MSTFLFLAFLSAIVYTIIKIYLKHHPDVKDELEDVFFHRKTDSEFENDLRNEGEIYTPNWSEDHIKMPLDYIPDNRRKKLVSDAFLKLYGLDDRKDTQSKEVHHKIHLASPQEDTRAKKKDSLEPSAIIDDESKKSKKSISTNESSQEDRSASSLDIPVEDKNSSKDDEYFESLSENIPPEIVEETEVPNDLGVTGRETNDSQIQQESNATNVSIAKKSIAESQKNNKQITLSRKQYRQHLAKKQKFQQKEAKPNINANRVEKNENVMSSRKITYHTPTSKQVKIVSDLQNQIYNDFKQFSRG